MWILLLVPLLYLAAVAQTALGDLMAVGTVEPDLVALVALGWLLTAGGRWAFLAAGAIMLAGDLIAPGRVGVGAGWMLLVGYGVTQLRARLPLDRLAAQVTTIFFATAIWALAVAATGRLLGDVPLPWSSIAARSAGVGLYTAAVVLPALMIVGWIRQPILARRKRLAEF